MRGPRPHFARGMCAFTPRVGRVSVNGSAVVTAPVGEGEFLLHLWATDTAGNDNCADGVRRAWIVDATPPTGTRASVLAVDLGVSLGSSVHHL